MFNIPFKTNDVTQLSVKGLIITLGIVYGDLGTSPLYTMQAILSTTVSPTSVFVLGALSCIFWTLTLQTTVKYVIIALRANNNGEGGIFSLFTLIKNKSKWTFIIAIIGACALLGDGVITPSITVTSAIEGLKIFYPDIHVVFFVILILSAIFFSQQFGTSSLGKYFGPVMVIWFSMLAVFGIIHLWSNPWVLKAVNPYYAFRIISDHPHALLLLGAVFLCTTGAEALYSDLGQCGMKNIRLSWAFVKASLLLNYFGQGAWILAHLKQDAVITVNPFFALMPHWFIPVGIIIATLAAIIASQALITGSFSIVSEAISLNYFPKIRIKYPTNLKGQVYIPLINWTLYICCMFIVFYFQNSASMQSAYGLSITIAMLMTTLLLTSYMYKRIPFYLVALMSITFLVIETTFLSANLLKLFTGGWVSILLTSIFISVMYIWYRGENILKNFISLRPVDVYKNIIASLSADTRVAKYSTQLVYITQSDKASEIENKIAYSILSNHPKRADVYWFLHVETVDNPHTLEYDVTEIIAEKILHVNIRLGFKVEPKINLYFNRILDDLVTSKQADIVSRYPSLREYAIRCDFRYLLIEDVQIKDYDFSFSKQLIMNYYLFLKKIIVNDAKALGLDATKVEIESIPLLSYILLPDLDPGQILAKKQIESKGYSNSQVSIRRVDPV